jgi:hypothetical protein
MHFWPLLLIGCTKEEPSDSVIEGSISVADIGASADVVWSQGFFAVGNGALLAFLTGAAGANCDDVADFLSSSDGVTEKEGIYDGGGCVMTIKVPDWDGSHDASWPSDEFTWNPAVDSSIRCEFGAGEWRLETNSSDREDYYWTGTTWSGRPDVFDWSFSEDGDDLEVQMDMSSYEGDLIYDSTGEVAGSGDIAGSLRVQACSGMEEAEVL